MTIEDVGKKVKEKDPQQYGALTPTQAGQRYLSQYPDNWERLPDPVVAQHIQNLKNTKHREASGIWAFFAKRGEKQRAEFFEKRVQTAQALVALEEQQHKLERLGIESQAHEASAALTIAQCKKTILSLGILGDLELIAAQQGMTLSEWQEHKRREHEQQIRERDRQQVFTHDTGKLTLQTDLKIKEAQSSHILQKEIEKLRHELILAQGDQQHRFAKEIEELRSQLREKEKQLEWQLKQQEIEKEVEGTLRLANTAELSRAQMIQLLVDYGKKLATATDFERRIYQKEIDRLEKELYGEEQGGVAGKTGAGNNPEGGAAPTEPGNASRGDARPGSPPDTSANSGLVN